MNGGFWRLVKYTLILKDTAFTLIDAETAETKNADRRTDGFQLFIVDYVPFKLLYAVKYVRRLYNLFLQEQWWQHGNYNGHIIRSSGIIGNSSNGSK